jgi:hypothetical protein
MMRRAATLLILVACALPSCGREALEVATPAGPSVSAPVAAAAGDDGYSPFNGVPSPDGARAVSLGLDTGRFEVHRIEDGRFVPLNASLPWRDVAWMPDSEDILAAIGRFDQPSQLVRIRPDDQVARPLALSEPVLINGPRGLAVCPDGKTAIVAGSELETEGPTTLYNVDLATGKITSLYYNERHIQHSIECMADAVLFTDGNMDGAFLPEDASVLTLSRADGHVERISDDAEIVGSATLLGSCIIYSVEGASGGMRILSPGKPTVEISASGRWLAAGGTTLMYQATEGPYSDVLTRTITGC